MSQSPIVRYQASTPNVKYLAGFLTAFTHNLRADLIQPILEKYHLQEITPGDWIDGQLLLDMLHDIETESSWEELVAVGMKAAELVPLPPEIDTMEKYLDALPSIYATTVRDVAAHEGIRVEKIASDHYRLIFNIPTPPFMVYGMIYGILVRRLRTKNQVPIISILDNGTPYTFDVKWRFTSPASSDHAAKR